MRRFLGISLWLIACCVCVAPAVAFWQSRDSNYNISAGAPAGYTGPGDVTGFTTGVIAWWGLRGFKSTTTGAIFNVCDNATGATCADATWSAGVLTIPTIGGNACDNATHKCEFAIFYDQSGAAACSGACDVSAVHGNRPILVVNCSGSKPCLDPNSSTGMVSANIAASTSQPYTNSAVALRSSGGQATIASAGLPAPESLFASAAGNVGMYAGTAVPTAAAADGAIHTLQFLFNNASSAIYVDATNNSPLSIGTSNAMASGAPFSFPSTASGGLTGQEFETGWWAGDKSSNFSDMHTNQCSYWGTTC